jgi:hypothetical protein
MKGAGVHGCIDELVEIFCVVAIVNLCQGDMAEPTAGQRQLEMMRIPTLSINQHHHCRKAQGCKIWIEVIGANRELTRFQRVGQANGVKGLELCRPARRGHPLGANRTA